MKRLSLALLALAGLATASVARADRLSVNGSIHFGSPTYAPAPVYGGPHYGPRGYWRDVNVRVWVPARWVTTRNQWGHLVQVMEPAHMEYRTRRVWVADEHPRYHHDRYDRHDDRGHDRHGDGRHG
ncbi:hypothetical protein [Opitutus sp. ER46]|uniref:hypothetical protein n=1 Tax=Opitutus sp. ER46 TaxID=2161864 RepID=UPI000D301CE3|nr:hypothetical protein [Opitutus sp. ER46]PTX94234.1 hypothetical protein DB354_10740 [Opitutus sp. ER46]